MFLKAFPTMLWTLLFLAILPTASAIPNEAAFPDISFRTFNTLVQETFGSEISLATVLMVLFTLTNNPTLLSLHARQQNPAVKLGERRIEITSWIKALAHALHDKLEDQIYTLQRDDEEDTRDSDSAFISSVGRKLDQFSKHLNLYPYNSKGKFQGKLKTISHAQIQPVLVICPDSIECEDISCDPRAVHQITRTRDIPKVTLVKGSDIYQNVPVLTGQCGKCKTLYSADHETLSEAASEEETRKRRIYLNSAKYLKVGQSIWVDRVFSNAVVNGMYSFHASASAYREYWNNSFGVDKSFKLSRRHIWQAFVQESTRTIAASAQINLELNDGLEIDEVTKEAFNILGEKGVIRGAHEHSCTQCTQKYKARSDININADPTAVVGVDNDQTVPTVVHLNPESSTSNLVPRENVQNDVMENEPAVVKLVVMDGIVMGPRHCAFDNCTGDLENTQSGVFCSVHNIQYGAKCRVNGCLSSKVAGTQACHQHKAEWSKYEFNHKPAIYSGMKRMLRRPGENVPWQPTTERVSQPHDEPAPDIQMSKNYFSAKRFYCVETICAPCGVVVAWTKFDKSESPTKILDFLESVYPTYQSKPNYVCIDKACLVLRTAITNGSWERAWKDSRFIVDSYHYINHRADDFLCRKYCNPAPLDGSAPNLVITETDSQGHVFYKRAFNTQACEQLNAWIGGFEFILKKMTPGNFNWFLHTMLFYHTQYVINKMKTDEGDEEDAESEDEI
jgi:hypothetical protein